MLAYLFMSSLFIDCAPFSLRIVSFCGINYNTILSKTLRETGDFCFQRYDGKEKDPLHPLALTGHKDLHHLPKAASSSLGTLGTSQKDCLDNWRENKEASKPDL